MDNIGHLHLRGREPVWYVVYSVDAISAEGKVTRKRVRERIGPASEMTEQQARARKNEILLRAGANIARTPAGLKIHTVAEFVTRHFIPEHVDLLKKAGQLHYRNHLKNHILPCIGSMKLKDVSHGDIQQLLRLKQQVKPNLRRTVEPVSEVLSSQTLRHIRNACSAIFRLAIIHKLHPGPNPAQYVRLPEMKRQQRHALSLDDCRTLLPALATPAREMALLSICTSMNFAEMTGLVWRRVNLTAQPTTADGENLPPFSLAIRQNHYAGEYGSVKAASRQRIVPLPTVVIESLRQIKAAGQFIGPEDPVFANNAGRPQTIANLNKRILKPTATRLGMGWVSWHAFRRTHATLLDQANVAVSDRVAQMGHSAFAMTLKYTSLDIERRRQSMEQVSSLVQERLDENQTRTKPGADESSHEG
jgi:integrase